MRKMFESDIKQLFVFDNTLGIKTKELKQKNGNKNN